MGGVNFRKFTIAKPAVKREAAAAADRGDPTLDKAVPTMTAFRRREQEGPVMPPLTRRVLDRAECDAPHCDHADHRFLVLHSTCHPAVPTWARYDKVEGVLTLCCGACERPVGALQIAAGEEDG
jgi:hypothetical protein